MSLRMWYRGTRSSGQLVWQVYTLAYTFSRHSSSRRLVSSSWSHLWSHTKVFFFWRSRVSIKGINLPKLRADHGETERDYGSEKTGFFDFSWRKKPGFFGFSVYNSHYWFFPLEKSRFFRKKPGFFGFLWFFRARLGLKWQTCMFTLDSLFVG